MPPRAGHPFYLGFANTFTPEPECAAVTYSLVETGDVLAGDAGIILSSLRHTAVATIPAVGGTTELFVEGPSSSLRAAEDSAFSTTDYASTAVGVAAGVFALIAVGWYARRRWLA